MEWALPEWTVLAVLREGPAHGFAIAALTAPTGALGRVWQLPRPVVYRALSRLEAAGLAAPAVVESGPGPRRTVYEITPAGASTVDKWLTEPVSHVRQLRSHLLMKLALLTRRNLPTAPLITAQRKLLTPIATAIAKDRNEAKNFDTVLLTWRHKNITAALTFLNDLTP